MKTKRNIAFAVLGMALGAALILTQAGWTDVRVYKLEGSWIGRVPGTPVMWSYALSPDPSGKSASMSGSVPVPSENYILSLYNLFPDTEYISPMVGQIRMTGRDTTEGTAIWYGMKKGFPFNQVVYIGLNNVQGRFTGTGQSMNTNHLAFVLTTSS